MYELSNNFLGSIDFLCRSVLYSLFSEINCVLLGKRNISQILLLKNRVPE